jgi:mRNA interferase RelE/StbE
LPYRIEFTPSAAKDYRSVKPTSLKSKIANALEEIATNPHQVGKVLKASLTGYYSYRIGKYRILYEILKKERVVVLLRIRHRRDVYR